MTLRRRHTAPIADDVHVRKAIPVAYCRTREMGNNVPGESSSTPSAPTRLSPHRGIRGAGTQTRRRTWRRAATIVTAILGGCRGPAVAELAANEDRRAQGDRPTAEVALAYDKALARGAYEISALFRVGDRPVLSSEGWMWAAPRNDGRSDVWLHRIANSDGGEPSVVDGPRVDASPLFDLEFSPAGPRDVHSNPGSPIGEALTTTFLFLLPDFPSHPVARGASWQVARTLPLGKNATPAPTLRLSYEFSHTAACRRPHGTDCLIYRISGATGSVRIADHGREYTAEYGVKGWGTFALDGVLIASEVSIGGRLHSVDGGAQTSLDGLVSLYHRPTAGEAPASLLPTPGPLEPTGPALAACPPDGGKCPSGTTCRGEICAWPAKNPMKHLEPLYFIWRAFEAIWEFGATKVDGRYRCPGALDGSVDTGPTPPLDVRCARGVAQRCSPGQRSAPGSYSGQPWQHPAWSALGLAVDVPHQFHYRFIGVDTNGPQGGCQFTVQAFGDLDDDGVYSTFERSGMYDHTGPNAAAGLYIDWDRHFE